MQSVAGVIYTNFTDQQSFDWLDAGCKVESATGRGREDTQAQWMKQQMCDDGMNAGIVDVFRRREETWIKGQRLVESDCSLSITDHFLLIVQTNKRQFRAAEVDMYRHEMNMETHCHTEAAATRTRDWSPSVDWIPSV